MDEVRRHWVAYVGPALEAWLALVLLVVGTLGVDMDAACSIIVLSLALMAHASWVFVRERRECFVITNMRVFRLHGVLVYRLVAVPLSRILDISVHQDSCPGGSSATATSSSSRPRRSRGSRRSGSSRQGTERDLTIQRVVQQ